MAANLKKPRQYKWIFTLILPFFIGHLKAQERPNVIVIISDDQGPGDVGFNGGKDIPTTHLDFWHRRALVLV